MKLALIEPKRWFSFAAVVLSFLFLMTGCARFSKQKPGEVPDLSQPRQSFYSAPIERLNSGFINVLTGPVDFVTQLREEVKRTNPFSGFLPGLAKGVTWLAVREVVGAFEIVTFFAPWKPHLKPVDVDWLSA